MMMNVKKWAVFNCLKDILGICKFLQFHLQEPHKFIDENSIPNCSLQTKSASRLKPAGQIFDLLFVIFNPQLLMQMNNPSSYDQKSHSEERNRKHISM